MMLPSWKWLASLTPLACLMLPLVELSYAWEQPDGRNQSAALPITGKGPIGTPDDSAVFQAAADEAEARGIPLVLPKGSTINLRGNVYLGDLTLLAAGSTINCLFDSRFRPRGTAALRGNGCILTKSAEGAGYGRRTVSIRFDSLTVNTYRSQGRGDAQIGLLLENTRAFVGQVLQGTASGIGVGEVTPFDFRRGVQGVRIDRVEGHMRNGAGTGGFWIRNSSPDRATSDIAIGTVEMEGATADELLAIFNTGSPKADLHDVRIDRVILRADGGCGQGFAIFRNAGSYDPQQMQRIAIGRVEVEIGRIGPKLSKAPGVFAVKVNGVDASIGSVAIRYSGPWAAETPHVYALRFVPGPQQAMRLHLSSAAVTVEARNAVPRGDAAMIWGPVVIDRLVVRGKGGGFRNIAVGAQDLREVDALTAAAWAEPFARTARLKGSLNGRPIAR